ncbi:GUN4 domain-containing protein [Nodosilinea sp. LEGE 07298]|uniref:caspase, EACC1-associated type n=1 Tax=Nodosilinea sp. LEGE 07298 TaxID=2777970 RepID=UPI00187FA419|nr:GUN4 domain-containing protein [Nodosilinea sp. LEGE 07298]MBE9109480.1 GUN4 domain-containing protein [Nodosilinea sp. LEGE 07298]
MGKYALLIGVDTYGEGLQPLPAASKDVAALREVLLNPQMGGFDKAESLFNPTQSKMAWEIESWFRDRQRDDLMLLFFSGHGVKDARNDLYFAAADTQKQRNLLMRSTATPARSIRDWMRDCKAKYQVIILDCCFSGAFGDLIGKDDGEINLKEQLGAEGHVILASTSSTTYSFEDRRAGLSIYTRYLVEGIATGAADDDGDGIITADELHQYAKRKVQEASPNMSPKISIPKGEGYRIELARSPKDDPRLKYRREVEHRITDKGELPSIARVLLNNRRLELKVSDEDAQKIEDEVREPYRERQSKRQNYERALREDLQKENPLSLPTIEALVDCRNQLGLRPEDTGNFEIEVLGEDLDVYRGKIQLKEQESYRTTLKKYLLHNPPLSFQSIQKLKEFRAQKGLNKLVETIEKETLGGIDLREYERKIEKEKELYSSLLKDCIKQDGQFLRIDTIQALIKERSNNKSLNIEDKQLVEKPLLGSGLDELEKEVHEFYQQYKTLLKQQKPENEKFLRLEDVKDLKKRREDLKLHLENVQSAEETTLGYNLDVCEEKIQESWQEYKACLDSFKERAGDFPKVKDIQILRETRELGKLHLKDAKLIERQVLGSDLDEYEAKIHQNQQNIQADLLDDNYPKDILKSERFGENYYAKLRDLLARQDWKAADQETAQCICELVDRQEQGWITDEDIKKIPYFDFHRIDNLWTIYSEGHFGFSVQEEILQNFLKSQGYLKWDEFGEKLEWRKKKGLFSNSQWVPYSQLQFKRNAPRGHLPFCGMLLEINEAHAEKYQTAEFVEPLFKALLHETKHYIGSSLPSWNKDRFYAQLRDLLAGEHWKDADKETARCIRALVGRPEDGDGAILIEEIKKLPLKDLHTIDSLWLAYSGGKFGFSSQITAWRKSNISKGIWFWWLSCWWVWHSTIFQELTKAQNQGFEKELNNSDASEPPFFRAFIPVIGDLFPSLENFLCTYAWRNALFYVSGICIIAVPLCWRGLSVGWTPSIFLSIGPVIGMFMLGNSVGRYIDCFFGFWSLKTFFEYFSEKKNSLEDTE